jgi:uncharacterized protein
MDLKYYSVLKQNNNICIANKVQLADQFWSRLKGLLGRKELEESEGLIIYPCSSIHCFGMQFPIDAVFLDENKKIIKVAENMPSKARASAKGGKYVLELKAGMVLKKQIRAGDYLEFKED